jgi:hypothetical protein
LDEFKPTIWHRLRKQLRIRDAQPSEYLKRRFHPSVMQQLVAP